MSTDDDSSQRQAALLVRRKTDFKRGSVSGCTPRMALILADEVVFVVIIPPPGKSSVQRFEVPGRAYFDDFKDKKKNRRLSQPAWIAALEGATSPTLCLLSCTIRQRRASSLAVAAVQLSTATDLG